MNAKMGARAIVLLPPLRKDPHFGSLSRRAKELTEKGLARRIPGVPDGCRHWVGEVSSETCGTRMVLFLRAAGEGCMQAIRDINVADEVLQWCQEKLPQHQVTPSPCLIFRHRRSLSLLPC